MSTCPRCGVALDSDDLQCAICGELIGIRVRSHSRYGEGVFLARQIEPQKRFVQVATAVGKAFEPIAFARPAIWWLGSCAILSVLSAVGAHWSNEEWLLLCSFYLLALMVFPLLLLGLVRITRIKATDSGAITVGFMWIAVLVAIGLVGISLNGGPALRIQNSAAAFGICVLVMLAAFPFTVLGANRIKLWLDEAVFTETDHAVEPHTETDLLRRLRHRATTARSKLAEQKAPPQMLREPIPETDAGPWVCVRKTPPFPAPSRPHVLWVTIFSSILLFLGITTLLYAWIPGIGAFAILSLVPVFAMAVVVLLVAHITGANRTLPTVVLAVAAAGLLLGFIQMAFLNQFAKYAKREVERENLEFIEKAKQQFASPSPSQSPTKPQPASQQAPNQRHVSGSSPTQVRTMF